MGNQGKNILKVLKFIFLMIEGIIVIVASAGAVLLSNSIRWMFDTWSYLTMDELIYQLKAPITGTNTGMIEEYVNKCVPSVILVFLFVIILMIAFRKKKVLYQVSMAVIFLLSCLLAGYYVHMAWVRLDISNYSRNQSTYSEFIDKNYIDARDVEIVFPEQKRNLIYIFLESMETTYADVESGGAFEENCIPELTELALENEDFSGAETALNGGEAMPGATWTMGAMFAQTSGLPLKIPIQGLNMDTQDTFFPDIVTLGDILKEAGYSQTLFIGSDATFAGRRLYFTEHGDYAMKDYHYAKSLGRIPEDYYVWWGYEDDRLFQSAKKELKEIARQDQPFNFTLLTVDTHFEDGYVCEDCGDEFGENQYANVMACSSKKVMEFVRWIQRQDFYENTTIVISGDHLTMDSDFCEDMQTPYVRRVYTSIINPAAEVADKENTRSYTTFDMYPTTLASLGVQISGERLGLGTNLFSTEKTLSEKYSSGHMALELQKDSKLMERLTSEIDMNNEELMRREGRLAEEETEEETTVVSADVIVSEYNFETGELPVTISNIQGAEKGIQAMNIAVWTAEDQSDLQWIQAVRLEDGSYYVPVNVPNFDYKTGAYYVDAYLVDDDGAQQMIGRGIGLVE